MNNQLMDIMLAPNTQITVPEPATTADRNPWGSVKTAQELKAANAWVDDMLKNGMIDKKQAEALKMNLMEQPQVAPIEKLSQDPKFLNKVFGK